jgi:hypothetical protein
MKILNNFIGNKYKLNNHINVIKKIYKKGFFQNDCIFYILNNDILLIIDKYMIPEVLMIYIIHIKINY